MGHLSDDDLQRGRDAHLFRHARDRTEELARQVDDYRRLTRDLPPGIGHSLDMLWLHFTHAAEGDTGRGGREHVLAVARHIRSQQVEGEGPPDRW